MERFYFKHDLETSIMTIEVTDKVAFKIIKSFREMFPIEMLSSKMEYVDVVNDEGFEYKNVRRYTTKIAADKVEIFFDAAKKMLSKSISDSITNSDN